MAQQFCGSHGLREPAVLEHDAHAGAQLRGGPPGVLAEQADRARGGLLEALGTLQRGGLARAVGPEQGRDAPGVGRHAETADRADGLTAPGERLDQVADVQGRGPRIGGGSGD